MDKIAKKSILQMAKTAIEGRINVAMAKLIDNILDENTDATATRELTLTIKITPNTGRKVLHVEAATEVTLAPSNTSKSPPCLAS